VNSRSPSSCAVAVACVAACIAFVMPSDADAAPWIVQPSVQITADYQTNPSFDTVHARHGQSESIGFSLPMASELGRHQFSITASGQAYDARGVSDGNRFGYGIDGSWSRAAERGALNFNAGRTRTSLLKSDRPDLGTARDSGYQNSTRAALNGNWQITERDQLGSYVSLSKEQYDVAPGSSLVDGSFYGAGGSYSRALHPRIRLSLNASVGRSDADDAARRSSNFSSQLGVSYQFDEYWSLQASGGISGVRNSTSGARHSGVTYSASLSRAMEYGSLAASASRSLQASAFGTSVRQDAVTLTWARSLSERVSFSSGLSWTRSSDTAVGFNLDRREYRQAHLSVSIALSPDWSMSASLNHTRSSSDSLFAVSGSSAKSTTGALSLSRRFGPLSLD
jgi:hypothetical protein